MQKVEIGLMQFEIFDNELNRSRSGDLKYPDFIWVNPLPGPEPLLMDTHPGCVCQHFFEVDYASLPKEWQKRCRTRAGGHAVWWVCSCVGRLIE